MPLSAIWWTCNKMSDQEWTLILKQDLLYSETHKRHFGASEWSSSDDEDSTGAYIDMADMESYKYIRSKCTYKAI